MSAVAISGGSAPKYGPSESGFRASEYAKEAWDLLADDVGMGSRNGLLVESVEVEDDDTED